MPDPELSVVVVTAAAFRNVRRTVAHLRAQTAAARMELIVVASSAGSVADARPEEMRGFARSRFVHTGGPIANVDRAAAVGVFEAAAPVTAIIEDHAYPEPEWAAHIIEAHQGECTVVGPVMVNANPDSPFSWTNLLIAYGPSTEPAHSGERDALPGHNLSYRTPLLRQFGDRLGEKLRRDGGLLDDLLEQGERFYLESRARLAHANPSRLAPTLRLRFHSGRLYGFQRAAANDWTPLHRILYVGGGLLIPFVRFPRFRDDFFGGGKRASLVPRVYPALFLGLVMDALGQMAGYALGPGNSREVLAVFEMDRMQHLNRADRKRLAPEG